MAPPRRGRDLSKRKPPDIPIVWERADRTELARFDPATKLCVMNCGPHRDDPRSDKERLFLCPECCRV